MNPTNPLDQSLPMQFDHFNVIPISTGQKLAATPVDSVTNFPAPRVEPLSYPGKRPEHAFTPSENQHVLPIEVTFSEGSLQFYVKGPDGLVWNANDALTQLGAASMEDRVPIVTFGSNANPGQLVNKFCAEEDISSPDQTIIPTTLATIKGLSPAYVPKVGIWGYSFADLVPDNAETVTEVKVNWLSPAQLEIMNKTEAAYMLCRSGDISLSGVIDQKGNEITIPAYLYASTASVVLDEGGKPIRLSEVAVTGSDYPELKQRELQEYLLSLTGEAVGLSAKDISVEALYAYIQSRPDHGLKKGSVGNAMADHLRSEGRVADISLLDTIPETNRNVTPLTLREILSRSNN